MYFTEPPSSSINYPQPAPITSDNTNHLQSASVNSNKHQQPPACPNHLQQAPAISVYPHPTIIYHKQRSHHHQPPASDP